MGAVCLQQSHNQVCTSAQAITPDSYFILRAFGSLVTASLQLLVHPKSPHFCTLLAVCCSLSDGTLTGSLSLCTSEGISGGSPLAGYPINNITKPAGTCSVDSDCNTAGGQFCNRQVTTSSCACAASTGQDTCTALGACELTPCSRCQRCIDGMQSAVQTQLLDSSKPPVSVIASRFTQTCENLASTAGYAITACSFISNAYILPSGSSGYFGLRPGALCSSLGQCASLPADCRLRTSAAPPLVNVTGNLDMCSAEGIAGGSPLRDVVVVAGEASRGNHNAYMLDLSSCIATATLVLVLGWSQPSTQGACLVVLQVQQVVAARLTCYLCTTAMCCHCCSCTWTCRPARPVPQRHHLFSSEWPVRHYEQDYRVALLRRH